MGPGEWVNASVEGKRGGQCLAELRSRAWLWPVGATGPRRPLRRRRSLPSGNRSCAVVGEALTPANPTESSLGVPGCLARNLRTRWRPELSCRSPPRSARSEEAPEPRHEREGVPPSQKARTGGAYGRTRRRSPVPVQGPIAWPDSSITKSGDIDGGDPAKARADPNQGFPLAGASGCQPVGGWMEGADECPGTRFPYAQDSE